MKKKAKKIPQLNYLLCRCPGLLQVFLTNGLVHLPTETDDLAIRLGLGLVAADDADRVSCVGIVLNEHYEGDGEIVFAELGRSSGQTANVGERHASHSTT